ncbi:Receptor-type guanylate cyclase gcy-22 [Phlyctochytrium bullatum]|nr:Receptor-type guanylate cyclase gcy-22 [Phlyctochytrium bullatum]
MRPKGPNSLNKDPRFTKVQGQPPLDLSQLLGPPLESTAITDDARFQKCQLPRPRKVPVAPLLRERAAKTQDDLFDLSPLTFLYLNFGFWCLMTVINIYFQLFGGVGARRKFDRRFADDWYRATAFTFAIACAFAYLGFVGTASKGKRSVILGMGMINFVVGVTWFMQATRMTVTLVDHAGNPLDVSRWLEWLHDMPALAYVIGRFTRAEPKHTWGAVNTSFWLTILGFLGALARHPYHELFATCSMVVFLFTCSHFEHMFQPAIDGETGSRLEAGVLKTLKWITLSTWWGIAIIWYIQKSHFVSFATGEALFCIAEIICKIVFMLVIVNNTMEESQNQKVEIAESLATELEKEMSSADKLLAKMIPQSVLEQLKNGQGTGTEEFACVTVFFSDIANFTVISSRTSTQDMLATLNKMWIEYDAIANRHGMYKVETIGDAFLGVVGAPDRVPDHAERAANFSLDIIDMIRTFKTVTGESIQIRAGLASGPVTGAIIGDANPHWCILGDTVSIASKMESSSKPMMVHINKTNYDLLKATGKYRLEEAEDVSFKGISLSTYFILGRA